MLSLNQTTGLPTDNGETCSENIMEAADIEAEVKGANMSAQDLACSEHDLSFSQILTPKFPCTHDKGNPNMRYHSKSMPKASQLIMGK